MRDIVLSIEQIRKWHNPHPWMVNGYSRTQDMVWLKDSTRTLDLCPGGWTLNAASYLRMFWEDEPDGEGFYHIVFDSRQIYRGLWTPKMNETVTESFFCDADLFVMNYRLLKVSTDA